MSTRIDVEPAQIDYHADLQWHRQQREARTILPEEVLEKIDGYIAQESDPALHPLYAIAAHALNPRVQAGSAEALMARFRRLVDRAIDALVDERLSRWED